MMRAAYPVLFLTIFSYLAPFASPIWSDPASETNAWMMNQDPAELEKMLENKGEGQAALNIMNQLGMDEAQKKELFKMAGDIFENWSEGLDENNAEERIGKIKQDPKGFYDSLDDDSKNRIKEFSRGLTGKSAPQ